MDARETIWWLLSDLFVDTTHTEDDLRRLGAALKKTGCGVEDLERILRYEVAPVCGTWMSYPGAIGPWPQFDPQDISAAYSEIFGPPLV